MEIWYILGFILFIVIAIAVYYFWNRAIEKEGFQTPGTNVVYMLNNPSNPNGLFTRKEANDTCVILGGRLAKYTDLAGLTFPDPTINWQNISGSPPPVGLFIYETNVTYSSYNGTTSASRNGHNYYKSNESGGPVGQGTDNFVPYNIYGLNCGATSNTPAINVKNFRGYPIPYKDNFQYSDDTNLQYAVVGLPYCYGPNPGAQVTLSSFFSSIQTITYDVTLSNGSSNPGVNNTFIPLLTVNPIKPPSSPTGTYNILDLNAIYTQLYIARNEFPIRLNKLKQVEMANIKAAKAATASLITKIHTYPVTEFPISTISTGDGDADGVFYPEGFDLNSNSPISQRLQGGYTALFYCAADYSYNLTATNDMLAYMIWNYTPGLSILGAVTINTSTGTGLIKSNQYQHLLLAEIQNYYTTLLANFESHPVAFILKGVANYPSMLNTFPVFNLPKANNANNNWVPQLGSCFNITNPIDPNNFGRGMVWRYVPPGTTVQLAQLNGFDSDYWHSNDWDWPDNTWYNHSENNGRWGSLSCPDNWWGVKGYPSSHAGGCICAYPPLAQQLWQNVGFAEFPEQVAYETNNIYMKNIFDSDDKWRPKTYSTTTSFDSYNSNIAGSIGTKFKTISYIGTISSACLAEIQESVSLSARLNFTDITTRENQIRISSVAPYKLYMSADASALPEYTTSFANNTVTLTATNNLHNNIHCNIEITQAVFFLLPFQTRNIIQNWAVARYNRVAATSTSGSGSAQTPLVPPFSAMLATVNIPGNFYDISVTEVLRETILNNMAQMYYNNQPSLKILADGSIVKGDRPGQAIITKFLDVYQVGTTILDVRYEEKQTRSTMFLTELATLNATYKNSMAMNLSKDDALAVEEQYLIQKQQLYQKDAANVWGAAENCGVKARYVQITSDGIINLSQVVVVDNTGANVAYGATVSGATCIDFGPNDPGTPSAPLTVLCDGSGNLLTDVPMVSYPGGPTISNKLTNTINTIRNSFIGGMEQSLTDGTMASRWYPNIYRTVASCSTQSVTIDLGTLQTIAAIRLLLPMDVPLDSTNNPAAGSFPNYTITIKDNIGDIIAAQQAVVPNVGLNSTFFPDYNSRTLIALYPGTGTDSGTCPNFVYDRYKVARFYFDPKGTDITNIAYWNLTGYSVGTDSALTFNPLYNAGTQLNLSSGSGIFVYPPKLVYSLNIKPPLNCGDPDQVQTVFGNDYNTFANDPDFRAVAGVAAALQNPAGYADKQFQADKIYGFKQIDDSHCSYYWSDMAIDTSTSPSSIDSKVYYRTGTFEYAYDTQDWNADTRTFIQSSTLIGNLTGPLTIPNADYTPFPGGAIQIPNRYSASTVLDTAGGFCPALPCSDPTVMASLIGNTSVDAKSNMTEYGYNYQAYLNNQTASNKSMPYVTKIHKAVTPTSLSCEYLVDTSVQSNQKLWMELSVDAPRGTLPCAWVPLTWSWDAALSPDMVDSVPLLTRAYNYASDVMKPFKSTVSSIVSEMTSAGSAQLDPAGSGIINALIKYRTDTNAAAGEMRYFDEMDEFGNDCVPIPTATAGVMAVTANFPRCKSPNLIMSLLNYYGMNYQGSRITAVLGAGLNENGQCDYTFTTASIAANGTDTGGQTSGLRCSVSRLPFSCEHTVNSCKYINPTPSLSELKVFPPVDSGSSGSSGSYAPITAAGANADSVLTQTISPQPTAVPIESVDYINCASDYAGRGTNIGPGSLTCSNGQTFTKTSPNYLYTSPAITPAFLATLPALPASTSTVALAALADLLPFNTIYATTTITANSVYEYRITNSDKMPFGSTYVHAEFYQGTVDKKPHLKVLRPATLPDSPNAFLKTSYDINKLATLFLTFWNTTLFAKANNNTGNQIGTITGYYINSVNDSIIFHADSADFGPFGGYDVLNYYKDAYYEVNFRNRFSDSSTFIYKTGPAPGTPINTSAPSGVTFTQISAGTDGSVGSPYSIASPATIIQSYNMIRYLRFTATDLGTRPRVEMARMAFYTGSGSSYTTLPINTISVNVQGILTNYDLVKATDTCGADYIPNSDPVSGVKFCEVKTPHTYEYVPGTACGLGYTKLTTASGVICAAIGYFQDFVNVGSLLVGNSYVPRLRLTPLHTYVQIDFNNIVQVNGFSFITGSEGTLPGTWTMDGSIDGNQWSRLHTQSTKFAYNDSGGKPVSVTAFYNPGIFPFSSSPNTVPSRTAQMAAYSNNIGSGAEGFTARPVPIAAASQATPTLTYTGKEPFMAYALPLKEGAASVAATAVTKKLSPRIQTIRFKVLETQNPDSPFVHMSRLQFHTKSGIVPPECIRISNPHGSRRSAKHGPDALLATSTDQRYTDYNKSELLIQFNMDKMPTDPIHGFQFYLPTGVANPMDAFPAKWVLEGSYDRRTWFALHEKMETARILGAASPVYQFRESP